MSNKKLAGIIGGCIALVITIVATATPGPKPVTDYTTLLHYLRNSGAYIVEKGEVSWSFFYDVEGRRARVDGSTIEVFEYATAKGMEEEASCVSPDGFGITKEGGNIGVATQVSWISLPHFFKAGRIIVIYIGEDDSMTSLLENALGAQFAGM